MDGAKAHRCPVGSGAEAQYPDGAKARHLQVDGTEAHRCLGGIGPKALILPGGAEAHRLTWVGAKALAQSEEKEKKI